MEPTRNTHKNRKIPRICVRRVGSARSERVKILWERSKTIISVIWNRKRMSKTGTGIYQAWSLHTQTKHTHTLYHTLQMYIRPN